MLRIFLFHRELCSYEIKNAPPNEIKTLREDCAAAEGKTLQNAVISFPYNRFKKIDIIQRIKDLI